MESWKLKPHRNLRRRTTALALLTALVLGSAPTAAEPSWTVGELTVTPRPGPVLWKVSRGASVVWIIGTLPVMPKGQAWNSARLERVIDGANVVLIRPRATLDFFTVIGILTHLNLPHDRTLDQELSAELAARFARVRALVGQNAARYAHLKPVWAGLRLYLDYNAAAKMTRDEPEATVIRLAHRHHVVVHPIATYRGKPVVKNLANLTDAQSRSCLADVVRDVEFASANAAPAAEAWAHGDLKTVRAHFAEPAFLLCLEQSPSFVALANQNVDDTVKAIDAALAHPGKSVAVFSLDDLLRDGGALARLRTEGATVTAPES